MILSCITNFLAGFLSQATHVGDAPIDAKVASCYSQIEWSIVIQMF